MPARPLLLCSASILLAWFAGACAQAGRHNATSAVDYLYPEQVGRVQQKPAIPVLRLPLRVGIAFVPSSSMAEHQIITEQEKIELMERIIPEFQKLDYVDSIEIIPSPYLRPHGSFTNLDQLRTMFGLDVIALLSYDQVQFTSQDFTSLSYWTILGAYVIQGEKNDTHTMVDVVVYDIASRTLLFRAPGVSVIKARATPVRLEEELRADRHGGFQAAADDLVRNLKGELDRFTQRVRENRARIQVVHQEGYTGGGSTDAWIVTGLVGLGAAYRWRVAGARSDS
jgi:rhombotail lipoprotein